MRTSAITKFNEESSYLKVDYRFNEVHARGHEWTDVPFPELRGLKLRTWSNDAEELPENPTWWDILDGLDRLIAFSCDQHHVYLGAWVIQYDLFGIVLDKDGFLNVSLDS